MIKSLIYFAIPPKSSIFATKFRYMKQSNNILLGACLMAAMVGCGQKQSAQKAEQQEDVAAKKMLQGVWIDSDDEDDVAFRVKGDTIYYPDSTSRPVYFCIIGDTLVMKGANTAKYPIVKQAAHIFQFKVANGDVVKLVKTSDPMYLEQFQHAQPVTLNQNKLVKRDTVVNAGEEKLHLYVQVNPTTYKVVKSTFNDDGVEVGNVYYDNIVNLGVFNGARRLFSSDFRKQDFQKNIPSDILRQLVLSDITFNQANEEGMHFYAVLVIPETSISYIVELVVTYDGKIIKRIKK